jgi:hypothetical protein
MRDIDTLINEFCALNLPSEPNWIAVLSQRFPGLAARFDCTKAVRWEFEDHLRASYEAHLNKGEAPDNAWKLARERFGDINPILHEIHDFRAQACKCLIIRLLAIVALFALPLGNNAGIRITQFFHLLSLCLMAASAAVGFLITRKRDLDSLRKYALYGAWLGLFWGIIRAITVQHWPTELGSAVSMILMSTFYGLFLAAPSARGLVPAAMMILCQVGMSIAFMQLGFLHPSAARFDPTLLILGAGSALVSLLVGLTVFDIRRLHRRLSGLAAFGMVFAWINICLHLTGSHSILEFVFATSMPVLWALLIALPLRKLRRYLLQEAALQEPQG